MMTIQTKWLLWGVEAFGLALNVFVALSHDTRKIYLSIFLFNIANLAAYLLLRDWATCASLVLIVVRSYLYLNKERFHGNFLPWMFVALHLVLGAMLMKSPWQAFTILAPVNVCLFMWYGKGRFQLLRTGNIVNASLWLFYNVYSGLWLTAACRVVTICANVFALNKNAKRPA